MKQEQMERLNKLQEQMWKIKPEPLPNKRYVKKWWKQVFNNAPDGKFKWDDVEAGDWTPWCCGDKDCPIQWHQTAQAINYGRDDEGEYIEIMTVDQDGNWEFDNEFREDYLDNPDLAYYISQEATSYNHFKALADYWIDCACTHKDPLKSSFDSPEEHDKNPNKDWVDFCLDGAEQDIRYLKMSGRQNIWQKTIRTLRWWYRKYFDYPVIWRIKRWMH